MTLAPGRKQYGTLRDDEWQKVNGLELVRGLVDGSLPLNTMAWTLCYDTV